MFDFEKLHAYKKARTFNKEAHKLLISNTKIKPNLRDQLNRASSSIILNIAEGSGRFTYKEKARYYLISRGSCYECVSVIDILLDIDSISETVHQKLYEQLEEISKILTGLMKSLRCKQ